MKLPFEIRNKSHRRSRFALLASTSIATSLWAAGAALAQNVSTPIPDVSVTAPNNTPGDGSTASGYRVDKVSGLGPFENLKIQDTPYTVNVISSDFIENTQSYATPDKVLEMMPGGVQYTYTSQRPVTGVANFRGSPTASGQQRIDGLPVASSSSLSFLEPFSRVEAISSVSGFMYGVGSSTGIFNYVLKAPAGGTFFRGHHNRRSHRYEPLCAYGRRRHHTGWAFRLQVQYRGTDGRETPLLLQWMRDVFHPSDQFVSVRQAYKDTYRDIYRYELSEREVDAAIFLDENIESASYKRFSNYIRRN